MTVGRKAKGMERIRELLTDYNVLDSCLYLDGCEYGIWEDGVRHALKGLEQSDPSTATLGAVRDLLYNVLAQALNRDGDKPYLLGVKEVAKDVGSRYPTTGYASKDGRKVTNS